MRRKALGLVSIVAIVLATLQLRSLNQPRLAGEFSGFPLDLERRVEVGWDDGKLEDGSARERRDQVRDWLLLAILSNAGLPASELNQVLTDMPPARYPYLRPVGVFEYGQTRARTLGKGRVVAVVPAGQSADARHDSLAEIADEYQKTLGKRPTQLLVFEYEIAGDQETATVTRRAAVPADALFTESAGYYTAPVHDAQSLEMFLGNVDDVTEARIVAGSLTVSGRKLRAGYRGVSVEDVAALWQSQAAIDENQRKIENFKSRWESRTYSTQAEKRALEEQYARETEQLRLDLGAQRAVDGSGFSLDPVYDYAALARHARVLLGLLDKTSQVPAKDAIEALDRKDAGPLLSLLYDASQKNTNPLLVELFRAIEDRDKYQAARYDGTIQGTRVGMTLFYTDLLAKLKAIDYWKDAAVSDFRPLTQVRVGRIYEQELQKLSGTRLWFGPQDREYQKTSDSIWFGRNVTRIYAASSDPLQPGKETPPNAESAAFLGWWDDHYEEVAAYEPEYQRLNEVMKWSLLLGWLSEQDGPALATRFGLADVPVTRNLWFPDWAQSNQSLRYSDWSRFQFFKRGYLGTSTEAMPILRSEEYEQFGYTTQLSGGVSLGNVENIKSHGVLTPEIQAQELRLRPGIDLRQPPTPNEINMLGGVKHVFTTTEGRAATHSSFTATDVKSRAPWAEVAARPIDRRYDVSARGLDIDITLDRAELGHFYSDVALNRPIRVGFRPNTVDRGQQFAERLSSAVAKGRNADSFIGSHPDLEQAFKYGQGLGCENCYLVKLRGTDQYMKMQAESEPSVSIAVGWQARAASLDPDAKNFNLAWLSDNELDTELKAAQYIRIEPAAGGGGASIPPTFTRGPPTGSPSEWDIGGRKFPVVVDQDGTAYLARKDLPAALDLGLLSKLRNRPGGDQVLEAGFGGASEPKQVLALLLEDPVGGKRAIDSVVKNARVNFDKALIDGRVDEANARLWQLQLFGQPDSARDALAAVVDGDIPRTVRAIRKALQVPGDRATVLDVIDQRMQSTVDAVESQHLTQIASMLDLGEGWAFADANRIAFEVRLTENAKTIPVAPSDAGAIRGPLYVLDTPSADPYVATYAAMPDQISLDLGTIVKLPRSDLAHARPRLIQTPDGKRYRLASASVPDIERQTGGRVPTLRYVRFATVPPCAGDGDAQPLPSSECREDVYLYDPPTNRRQ